MAIETNAILELTNTQIDEKIKRWRATSLSIYSVDVLEEQIFDDCFKYVYENSTDIVAFFNMARNSLPVFCEWDDYLKERINMQLTGRAIVALKKFEKEWYKNIVEGEWERYCTYLEKYKNFEMEDIIEINDSTSLVMNSMIDPHTNAPCESKGMVIGDIQSGKTANFMGLMAKAIDSNINIIVVLTGTINALRNQTQIRIQNDLLGRDDNGNPVGIGTCGEIGISQKAYSQTSASSDLNVNSVRSLVDQFAGKTIIFVMKKNSNALNKFLNAVNDPTLSISKLSIMVIDDESDLASINTKTSDEPTTINRLIKEILGTFKRNYYVAYTATPFANLFIEKGENEYGITDLFPSDFIIRLLPSVSYTGYDTYFSDENVDYLVEEEKEMDELYEPLFEYIVAASIKKYLFLTNQVKSKHSSMLVQMSHKMVDHADLHILVTRFLSLIESEYYNLFDEFHEKAIQSINNYIDTANSVNDMVEYEFEMEQILDILSKMIENKEYEVLVINSDSQYKEMELVYDDKYRNYIVIGGNALSRGLTLEGLINVVFERNSRAMDTYEQMARWYGYRSEYFFLTKLYIDQEGVNKFTLINEANNFLTEQLLEMDSKDLSAEEFQFLFRDYKNFKPTSSTKLKNATKQIGFSSKSSQIIKVDATKTKDIISFIDKFASQKLDIKKQINGENYYDNIDANLLCIFLEEYHNISNNKAQYNSRTNPKNWIDYIKKKNSNGELTNWTIVFRNFHESEKRITPQEYGFGKINFGMRTSTVMTGSQSEFLYYRMISSPAEEALDFEINEVPISLEKVNRLDVRNSRNEKNGLLVVYHLHSVVEDKQGISLMVSFPNSPTEAREQEFLIN